MGRSPLWTPPGRDVLYVDEEIDTDYVNLEDMLVVFCVDISGSMSVTTEVTLPLVYKLSHISTQYILCLLFLINSFCFSLLSLATLFFLSLSLCLNLSLTQVSPGNSMRSPTYISRLQVTSNSIATLYEPSMSCL